MSQAADHDARTKWYSFSKKDRIKCYENDYSCLRSGLYYYDNKWKCGCE